MAGQLLLVICRAVEAAHSRNPFRSLVIYILELDHHVAKATMHVQEISPSSAAAAINLQSSVRSKINAIRITTNPSSSSSYRAVAPYLITMVVLAVANARDDFQLSDTAQFCAVLGIGALPAIFVLWGTAVTPESTTFRDAAHARAARDGAYGSRHGHHLKPWTTQFSSPLFIY